MKMKTKKQINRYEINRPRSSKNIVKIKMSQYDDSYVY